MELGLRDGDSLPLPEPHALARALEEVDAVGERDGAPERVAVGVCAGAGEPLAGAEGV